MEFITNENYVEPAGDDPHKNIPLVIYRRSSSARPAGLVVFVHGLTGTRYGYWNQIPRFIFEDLPKVDVGLYCYETAFGRFHYLKTLELEEQAEDLADELANLTHYDHIVVVGHSMGGILVRGAILRLLSLDRKKVLRNLVGLILVASPTAGSLRVPFWSWPFSSDARALFPHNSYLRRLAETLRAQIDPQYRESVSSRVVRRLPTWAIRASNDFWVDRFSSSHGVRDNQLVTVRGTHGSIIAAQGRDHDGYRRIKQFAELALGLTATESDDDVELRCEDVPEEDAYLVHEFAVHTLGSGITSAEDIADLIRAGAVIRVLKEMIPDGEVRTERVTAYFCALPLTAEATHQLKEGLLEGHRIVGRHLAVSASDAACIYIGAVAGRGTYPRGMVLRELEHYLAGELAERSIELITHPITADGNRLARKHRFVETYRPRHDLALWARGTTVPGVALTPRVH